LVGHHAERSRRGNSRREIKAWGRGKKVRLIEASNPGWLDLALDWVPVEGGQDPSLRWG
jgi:predicted GIY-YIG superfamily endonuclease